MFGDAISPPMISFDYCLLHGDARIRGLPDRSKVVAFPYHVQATKYTKSSVWNSCVSGSKFERTGGHECLYWSTVAMYRRRM